MSGQLISVEQVAPLLWTPWYVTRLDDPQGVAWVWPIVQDVCHLPDPEDFPSLEHEWAGEGLAMLHRYVDVCERLLATTVLNTNAEVSIEVLSGTVTKVVPADDATVGFVTLLRQIYKPDEEASFDRIRGLLSRAAHASAADAAGNVLKLWRDAHRTLLKKHIHALLEDMARARGLIDDSSAPGGARPFVDEDVTPRELLEVFLYGDLVHWGDERDRFERWQKNEQTAATMEINMRQDAHGLAHFYLGFAGIARVILRRTGGLTEKGAT